ncbi:possible NAD(+) synthetase [Aurantimonas manganoxydans SI85-9A1]|uniref:Glutamine-dependent NAD(+) synthetase n=1 Tax=Aurantimonas manganoxydans (strain ATCC BAA-1229 / DSM 21871 / SI85-9A1) TaxID=287752 RepID=Q1YMY6_AURMS|nr:nitrilase-related carbon-nitrogen hydrolase [Aurantimonas manganoxydans]EAS51245.1 possible NAD(+) synthetase [Aurantimonas manganoxydans SI85-9A1]
MPHDDNLNGRLRLAIAQIAAIPGDLAGNLAKARAARDEAAGAGAQLVVFPAGFLAGSPHPDSPLAAAFVSACMDAVDQLANDTGYGGPGLVIGSPRRSDDGVHDSVAVLDAGRILTWRDRVDLPHARSFEEPPAYRAGPMPGPVAFRGLRLGIPIGDDLRGDLDVCETLAESGAELLLAPSAMPFRRDGIDRRHQAVLRQVIETDLPMVFVNGVGGQGVGVMDGGAFAFQADRTLALQSPQFGAGLFLSDWQRTASGWRCETRDVVDLPGPEEAIWRACVCAIRAHAEAQGTETVALALHGDADTAIVAAMAVDAMGPSLVKGLLTPDADRDTADTDAVRTGAAQLGIACHVLPLTPVLAAMTADDDVSDVPASRAARAQMRGALLVALAERTGAALLGATNRTALRLGNGEADGVLAAGLNPIADLSRSDLADLARWRRGHRPADSLGADAMPFLEWPVAAPTGTPTDDAGAQDAETVAERLFACDGDVDAVVAAGFDRAMVQAIAERLIRTALRRSPTTPGLRLDARATPPRTGRI